MSRAEKDKNLHTGFGGGARCVVIEIRGLGDTGSLFTVATLLPFDAVDIYLSSQKSRNTTVKTSNGQALSIPTWKRTLNFTLLFFCYLEFLTT